MRFASGAPTRRWPQRPYLAVAQLYAPLRPCQAPLGRITLRGSAGGEDYAAPEQRDHIAHVDGPVAVGVGPARVERIAHVLQGLAAPQQLDHVAHVGVVVSLCVPPPAVL